MPLVVAKFASLFDRRPMRLPYPPFC